MCIYVVCVRARVRVCKFIMWCLFVCLCACVRVCVCVCGAGLGEAAQAAAGEVPVLS